MRKCWSSTTAKSACSEHNVLLQFSQFSAFWTYWWCTVCTSTSETCSKISSKNSSNPTFINNMKFWIPFWSITQTWKHFTKWKRKSWPLKTTISISACPRSVWIILSIQSNSYLIRTRSWMTLKLPPKAMLPTPRRSIWSHRSRLRMWLRNLVK